MHNRNAAMQERGAMTLALRKHKSEMRRHVGTGLDGAVVGGAIGAFAAGPVGTIVGMIIGGLTALAVQHFAEMAARPPRHTASPTK
jgi:hypothetical protein